MPNGKTSEKFSEEEFVLRAIHNLRKPGHKGIHTVYSGFNTAFREYFGAGADPVTAVHRLIAKDKVIHRPAKGGATIWDAAEVDEASVTPVPSSKTLKKILENE